MTSSPSLVPRTTPHHQLLDAMGTGVLAANHEGRVEFLNRAGAELLEVDAASVVGRDCGSLKRGGRDPALSLLAEALETAVRSGVESRRQLLVLETEEGERNYGYTVSPIPAEASADGASNGECVAGGAVLVFTELTAVRRRERTLTEQEYSASLGRVAAWMAHEVKNPLATIKMYSNLIARSDPSEIDEGVQVIRDQVEVAQTRISDILRAVSFSPEDSTGLTVCALDETIRAYVEREGRGLPHATIESHIRPDEYLVPMSGQDATSLVSHLVTNAAEALEGPGSITITLDCADGMAVLEITDTGPGFPEEDLARLFQPFFTSKARGTGLGLWTVRRIVESRRGEVQLKNTEAGGARVTVKLPILDRRLLTGKRILVVDDEESLRKLITRQLRDVAGDVGQAATGIEALEALERARYDVLITDVRLPGMDGAELLTKVDSTMPVLVISGNAGLEAEFSNMRRRGLAFLSKPFDSRELVLALSYLLWEVSA